MSHLKVRKLLIVAVTSSIISSNAVAYDDPCSGLLNLTDRPSNLDSACSVPFKQGMLEMGYEYEKLYKSNGEQHTLPIAEIRIGLPVNNEVAVILPNYIHQNIVPHYGNTATTVVLKHEIGYNQNWVGAVEALVTLPGGSSAFGSNGVGTSINAIAGYTFNPKFNLSFSLASSTQTTSSLSGGQRYTTFNPDVVFTYSPTEKCDVYAEVFGQSKTGPGDGSGFNADAGVLYLINPKWEIDFEVGQRISGTLNSLNHYIGTGTALQL
jgi:hypothetical protein